MKLELKVPGCSPFGTGAVESAAMDEATTYRRYAEDCHRLAAAMGGEDRRALLEMAHEWLSLTQQAEGLKLHGRGS
jgi:hypothetical protein